VAHGSQTTVGTRRRSQGRFDRIDHTTARPDRDVPRQGTDREWLKAGSSTKAGRSDRTGNPTRRVMFELNITLLVEFPCSRRSRVPSSCVPARVAHLFTYSTTHFTRCSLHRLDDEIVWNVVEEPGDVAAQQPTGTKTTLPGMPATASAATLPADSHTSWDETSVPPLSPAPWPRPVWATRSRPLAPLHPDPAHAPFGTATAFTGGGK